LQEEYQRLQQIEQVRQEMVTILVHDLRVPVSVILNSLELVATEFDQALNQAQRDLLGCANRASRQILELVTNLLQVRQLQGNMLPVRPQSADIIGLIQSAFDRVRPLAELKGVALHAHIPHELPLVMADVDLTIRIVSNLLDNAVKYTPSGGGITVISQVDEFELTTTVSDDGPGIPADLHDCIFEQFFQANPDHCREQSSVGLGLAFCKLAVEAQRGRIWVESEPGTGAQFKFTLPVWQQ
jgi:signal transduction histidine kinase